MSLLYKKHEDLEYTVEITQEDGKVKMLFWDDGGKFGTHEILDEYEVTPLELLEILQASQK